ncbi:MAG: SH3b protein, partial [Anaerolineales bacterium]|nr:SH3b protein [Anaerolineales bacterium]
MNETHHPNSSARHSEGATLRRTRAAQCGERPKNLQAMNLEMLRRSAALHDMRRAVSLFERASMLAVVVLVLMLGRAPSAAANGGVTFKVIVQSAFLRSEPSASSTRVLSVFRNQVFPVTGRNGDNTWLQLNGAGWISSALDEVRGDLSAVSVLAGSAAPSAPDSPSAPTPLAVADSSTTPGVTLKMTITAKSAFVRTAPTAG